MKKTPIIAVMLATCSIAIATTDWGKLFQDAPRAVFGYAILNKNGTLGGDVAKLPNGKFRLVNLVRFYGNHRPIVYVDTIQGMNVEQLCRDSIVLKAKFAAQLKLATLPDFPSTSVFENAKWIPETPNSNTETSNSKSTLVERIELENPFSISLMPNISYDKYLPRFSRYPLDPDRGSNDGRIYDYYKAFLQAEIDKQPGGTVLVDLTEHNGFACDLMLNNIQLRVDARVSYETGMPVRTEWVKKDHYEKMFQAYWTNIAEFSKLPNLDVQDPATAAFISGLSSTVFEGDEVAKKPTRVQALLISFNVGMNGIAIKDRGTQHYPQIENNYYANIELTVPKSLVNDVTFQTSSDAAATLLMKEK